MDLSKPQKTAKQGWNLQRDDISSSSCLWLKLEIPSSEVTFHGGAPLAAQRQQENGGKKTPRQWKLSRWHPKRLKTDIPPPPPGRFSVDFHQRGFRKADDPFSEKRAAMILQMPIPKP